MIGRSVNLESTLVSCVFPDKFWNKKSMDYFLISNNVVKSRDVVALRAKPQKPVLQGQKTSSCKIESM